MRSMHCSLLQAARAIWRKNNEEAELVTALDMKDRRHAAIFGELTVKVKLKNEKYAELAMKYNSCVREERAAVQKAEDMESVLETGRRADEQFAADEQLAASESEEHAQQLAAEEDESPCSEEHEAPCGTVMCAVVEAVLRHSWRPAPEALAAALLWKTRSVVSLSCWTARSAGSSESSDRRSSAAARARAAETI